MNLEQVRRLAGPEMVSEVDEAYGHLENPPWDWDYFDRSPRHGVIQCDDGEYRIRRLNTISWGESRLVKHRCLPWLEDL